MLDSAHDDAAARQTIDQTLLAGNFSGDAFSPLQRELLRALFFSQEFAEWKEAGPCPLGRLTTSVSGRGGSQRPVRSEQATQDPLETSPQACGTDVTTARSIRSKRSREITLASDQASLPAEPAAKRLRPRQKTRPASNETVGPATQPAKPIAPQKSNVLAKRNSPSKERGGTTKEPTAQDVLRHFQPIEDPTSWFSRVKKRFEEKDDRPPLEGLDHAGNIVGTYVRAKEDEDESSALRKIASLVWVMQYPDRRISAKEYEKVHKQTGVDVERLKKMVSDMNYDGRARLNLVKCFGMGVTCIVDDVRKWGREKWASAANDDLRARVNQDNRAFAEQCARLAEPTLALIKFMQNEISWQPRLEQRHVASRPYLELCERSMPGIGLGTRGQSEVPSYPERAVTTELPSPHSYEPPRLSAPTSGNHTSDIRHDSTSITDICSTQDAWRRAVSVFAPQRTCDRPRPPPRIRRVVMDTAESIRLAIAGDTQGLRRLFEQGLARSDDVSQSRGFTLIRWALYGGMQNYPTIKFLLDAGARVDDESYHHAWDYVTRRQCTCEQMLGLSVILSASGVDWDWEAVQEFPRVHRIVQGRKDKLRPSEEDEPTLASELRLNPTAVDDTDRSGRSALDWATAMANLADMHLLLDRKSPVNTMDLEGRTTVLHAVDSHSSEALRMILEAGGDPNPELPPTSRRSSPLIAASFGGLADMVELLIKHGAKVDACNPEGWTALQKATSVHSVACVEILLACGADPVGIARNGHSALTIAIMYNSTGVLELFLKYLGARKRFAGPSLIPFIAKYATTRTISMFAASNILFKQTVLNSDDLVTGLQTVQSREDLDIPLSIAFNELVKSLQLTATDICEQ